MTLDGPLPDSSRTQPDSKAAVVLRAARTVFFSHGFSGATTDMIQREAGVSKATVYACYATKEALFVAVLHAQIDASVQSMREIRYRPGQLEKTLEELARTYLGIVLSRDGLALCRVAIAEAMRFPELARKFHESGPLAMVAPIAQVLAEAVDANDADLGDMTPDAAATFFLSLVRNDAQLRCLTHPDLTPPAAQRGKWAKGAVAFFMRAVASRGAASRRR